MAHKEADAAIALAYVAKLTGAKNSQILDSDANFICVHIELDIYEAIANADVLLGEGSLIPDTSKNVSYAYHRIDKYRSIAFDANRDDTTSVTLWDYSEDENA